MAKPMTSSCWAPGSSARARPISWQRRVSASCSIDGEAPAWGASGRNPGFQWLHTRKAGIQMELGLAGRRLADTLREELDDFEMRPSGGMIYFIDERQAPLFRSFVAERRAAGLPMELIDARQAREHCPILSEKVLGAS